VQAFHASYAQTRLWFLHQLQPGLTAYHLPALWRLRGPLDHQALAQALKDLISRHPTLRTSFRLHGQELLQIVHPPAPLALPAEAPGDRDPEQVIRDWLQQEATTPFDLGAGLLLRARLLQVAADHHLLLINHHHIASDGWSCSVLASDLSALYNAHRNGLPSPLPPLAVHYQDYALWQRQRLSGSHLQALHDVWIDALQGLEPLELPVDHPRPATPSHRGASLSVRIDAERLAPFEQLCRAEGATLQMGLLALLALLLHRYSRQDDVAIGIPIWGRNHPDFEPLIGFFINTLPIRIRFRPALSFRQLLAQVRATSIAAYDHQELPFEQMVEALNLERDTSRNPLVQVMLQLSELPEASLEGLSGLAVEALPTPSTSAKLDLSFHLRRSADQGLRGSIIYATELFSADRIERLAAHLGTLLASAVEAPDAPAMALRLLPEAERQRIAAWQHGPRIALPDQGVQQRFAQQAARTPDAVALRVADQPPDQHLSYRELNRRADALAQQLEAAGVGPEVIVGVCLPRAPDLIVALLAILKAGGAYLPLDPDWPPQRQRQLLQQAGAGLLIDREGQHALTAPVAATAPPPARPLAYLCSTSGSTGTPKAVAITHPSILRLVDPINGFRLGPGSAVLHLAPVAFDAATLEIWGPLLNGGTLVLAPPEPPSLADLAALLRRQQITTLWLTAGLFHAMVDQELDALAGVRQVLAGGDVLHPAAVRRLLAAFPEGHELINGYGPTENTTFTCCQRFRAGEHWSGADVPIGTPIAMTSVHLLEPGGQPCPIGVPGELHIGGAGLARGYHNNPEGTAERFIPDPFSPEPAARLYRSGDLASWTTEGRLAFHGRIDQQIKLRGFRIEPGEIEAHLLAHPAVAQAAVVLRRDDPAHPRLIAYWVPALPAADHGGGATAAAAGEFGAFLAERLPDVMVPSAFVPLETLPLTANGKLDRRALPAPSLAGDRADRRPPGTDLERQLHGLWAEVLGHDDFGITDNFFVIGGHSLAAARLLARIEQDLAIRLPLATIFHAPQIQRMAELLQRSDQPEALGDPCLVPLQPAGEGPPLVVIHGYAGDVFCYTDFALALTPPRPVYGLQAQGLDGGERHRSVEEMVRHYADLLERQWPDGPLHLLGQSAGGWYAWALASELLRRGRPLGTLVILDTGPTAALSRRLLGWLLLQRALQRLPGHLKQLRHSKRPANLLAFLRQRRDALALQLRRFQPGLPALQAQLRRWQAAAASHEAAATAEAATATAATGADATAAASIATATATVTAAGAGTARHAAADQDLEAEESDYYDLLHQLYRPSPEPLRVELFTSRHEIRTKRRLWRALARAGVHDQQLFTEHHHFHDPAHAAALARAVSDCLRDDGAPPG
jgi:amino acid adenylation domain-containing protein